MPNHARSHDENRKVVCIMCLRKGNRELTPFLVSKIQNNYKEQFNFDDPRIPQGLCDPCRLALGKCDQGQKVVLPKLFQFETIDIKVHTRGQDCDCLICDIGRLKLTEKHPLERTKTGEKTSDRRCSTCLSLIGRGLPHHCSSSQFRENLRELAKSDGIVAEQIASSTIVSKESSPCGTIRLVQPKGGGLLPITQGLNIILH